MKTLKRTALLAPNQLDLKGIKPQSATLEWIIIVLILFEVFDLIISKLL